LDIWSLNCHKEENHKGARGNISNSWLEAAKVLKLNFIQCCPKGYEMDGALIEYDLHKAIHNSDVSEDVIDSRYFVGYEFKKALVLIQQAILLYLLKSKKEQISSEHNEKGIVKRF